MSLPTYPKDDLDDIRLISSTAGTFWSEQFEDRQLFRALFRGVLLSAEQAGQNCAEARDALSWERIRPFHRVGWKKLFFRQSDQEGAAIARYGEGRTYGEPALFYGVGQPDGRTFQLSGEGLVRIGFVQNRITAPSLLWVGGLDFHYDPSDGRIRFPSDLFSNPGIPVREAVLPDGRIEREVVLWAHQLDYDERLPYDQLGYALRLSEPTSEAYVRLLRAVADQHVRGPTVSGLTELIAASLNIPIVRAAEPVRLILTEPKVQICTATQVYTYPRGSVPSVSVGDLLGEGTVPVRGFAIWDLAGGLPSELFERLGGISLDAGLLGPSVRSALSFDNRSVPLISWQSGGRTRVEFEVQGRPDDVAAWWADIRAREDQTGLTLAQLLVRQADPLASLAEPVSWQRLPRAINPLRFILDLLRSHLVICWLDGRLADPRAPGLSGLRSLRTASMPHMLCLVIVEVRMEDGQIETNVDTEVQIGQALLIEEQGSPLNETAVLFRQGAG